MGFFAVRFCTYISHTAVVVSRISVVNCVPPQTPTFLVHTTRLLTQSVTRQQTLEVTNENSRSEPGGYLIDSQPLLRINYSKMTIKANQSTGHGVMENHTEFEA